MKMLVQYSKGSKIKLKGRVYLISPVLWYAGVTGSYDMEATARKSILKQYPRLSNINLLIVLKKMNPKGRIVYRLSNQLHHSYINDQENDVSDLLIEELRQNEKVVDPLPAIEHSQRLPVGLESDTATRTQTDVILLTVTRLAKPLARSLYVIMHYQWQRTFQARLGDVSIKAKVTASEQTEQNQLLLLHKIPLTYQTLRLAIFRNLDTILSMECPFPRTCVCVYVVHSGSGSYVEPAHCIRSRSVNHQVSLATWLMSYVQYKCTVLFYFTQKYTEKGLQFNQQWPVQ